MEPPAAKKPLGRGLEGKRKAQVGKAGLFYLGVRGGGLSEAQQCIFLRPYSFGSISHPAIRLLIC